jgi:AhpD family alkylhydroperoxidase
MERANPFTVAPEGYRAMSGVQRYVNECGLEHALLELVKLRASQINGCAFCLAMHTRDMRKMGESEDRMHLLNAWREAPIYSARERAALAWTEAVTRIADRHVPDDIYAEARRHFSEKELTDLTLAVVVINGWNRLMIAFERPPQLDESKAA